MNRHGAISGTRTSRCTTIPSSAARSTTTHADGSGVAYSSRLRPVLNFTAQLSFLARRPRLGGLPVQCRHASLRLARAQGRRVRRDHRRGPARGGPRAHRATTRSIMTGTHPEYHSTAMWDAMKAWIDRGGRLMYMGGNGWYWRVAFHDELPGVIELRRAEDGIRTWIAEPGEYFHSFNGEYGGFWRRIGRAPNVMAGVGFIAQGFDVSSYYRRAPDADNPRAALHLRGRARRDHRQFRSRRRRRRRHRARLHHDASSARRPTCCGSRARKATRR